MKTNIQKRIAAGFLKVSPKRVKLDPTRAPDLKEAITKTDLRGLVGDGAITKAQKTGSFRSRTNKLLRQKSKGQRKGAGHRKGKQTTHTPKKETWMAKIRTQRAFLRQLRESGHIDKATFSDLYKKAKGGFFRSKKHIKLYIDEHRLTKNE